MKILDLHSEQFAPSGNLAADGLLNQLGRPKLDMMTVLVREAVQNSWDARASDDTPVSFAIDYQYLREKQLKSLRHSLRQTPVRLSLANLLANDQIPVLIVSDYGTTGLNGPTRADYATINAPNNFVNFVRNAGSTTRDVGRGGTYGYGKSVFFHASSVGTICVYTRFRDLDERSSSRFIVCAAEPSYYESDPAGRMIHFTGRHWWGVKNECENFVEPLLDALADEIALAIGMPVRSEEQMGTSVMIIGPRFDELEDTRGQVQKILDELVVYAWPKLVAPNQGKQQMRFSASFAGNDLECIDPQNHAVLQHFVQALRNIADGPAPSMTTACVQSIASKSPARNVGKLSMVSFIGSGHLSELDLAELVNHVALMRKPGLIVKYQPGPSMLSGELKYAGVFVADAGADDSFARSEPPTHDDWRADYLDNRTDKIIVNASNRGIAECVKEFVQPRSIQTGNEQYPSLVLLADALAELIPAEEGTAPADLLEPVTIPGQPKDPRADVSAGLSSERHAPYLHDAHRQRVGVKVLDNDLRQQNGARYVVAELQVVHAANSLTTRIRAIAKVVLEDDELEEDPPQGAAVPIVEKWLDGSNNTISDKDTVVVDSGTTRLNVWVRVPEDAVVELSFRAERVR